MIRENLQNFKTVTEMQQHLDTEIAILKQKSEELSRLIGEKLRSTESTDNAELQELKQRLDGGSADPKKKKPVKKKDQKDNWYDVGTIKIYDGIGLKGEIEMYFKVLDEFKLKMDKLEKIKESVDNLISKGVRSDLGCSVLLNPDTSLQICFIKRGQPKQKFSYKAIFNIPSEHLCEIKI